MGEAIPIFDEECLELAEAVLMESDENVAAEAADVFVTAIGMLSARGISYELLEQALEKVRAKNDAKTPETHMINHATGKIIRIRPS